ncbi:DMT family transporter [Vibrio sp. SM6]|uniref:DMT family transporter n=1 Tax=Vibrio agarilyticus TaxID=2726741 RepID=A0A7X8YFS4_9VIBR|nr:DMT family transporter [Vibrio agarilyticus]NLS11860.1 DMT family transporter [Vibrio agarilyticus]
MKNHYFIGVVAGLLSGLTWALNTTLIGVSIHSDILADPALGHKVPFLSNFLNDIFVTLWILLAVIFTRKLGVAFRTLFSRRGGLLVISGILGGPLGMLFFVLGVKYAGVGYTSVISSIYPVIGAVLSAFLLKEKLSGKNYLGVVVIVISVSYLSYQTLSHPADHLTLGVMYAFCAALGWAVQAVFLAWCMRDSDVPSHVALLINVSSALLIDLTVLLPAVDAMHLIEPVMVSQSGQIAFGAATIGAISTWMYYVSIRRIGATKAMGLDITYGVWAEIIQVVITPQKAAAKLVVTTAVIAFGVILTITHDKLRNWFGHEDPP